MNFLLKINRYLFEFSFFEYGKKSLVRVPIHISFKKEIYDKYSTTYESFDIIKLVTIGNSKKFTKLIICNKPFTLKDEMK